MQNCSVFYDQPHLRKICIFIWVPLTIWIASINGTIAHLILTIKGLRKYPRDIFILNLCISDLTLGTFVLGFSMFDNVLFPCDWKPEWLCNFWVILDWSTAQQSSSMILLITLDRLFTLNPTSCYHKRLSLRSTYVLCFLHYIIFVSFYSLLHLLLKSTVSREISTCMANFLQNGNHWVGLTVGNMSVWLPVILTLIASALILTTLRKYRRSGKHYKYIRMERGTKLLLILMAVSAMTYCPYAIQLNIRLGGEDNNRIAVILHRIAAFFLYSSAAFNPLIYTCTTPRLRQYLLAVFNKIFPSVNSSSHVNFASHGSPQEANRVHPYNANNKKNHDVNQPVFSMTITRPSTTSTTHPLKNNP